MSVIVSFFFPARTYTVPASVFLLALRLFFGGMLMWYGIGKIMNFSSLAEIFPDPLGVGNRMSLVLALFAEVICAAGVMVGAFYRLALIPIIFSMFVIILSVHGDDAFSVKELPVVYLVMFVLLFASGAGNFALDNIVAKHLHRTDV